MRERERERGRADSLSLVGEISLLFQRQKWAGKHKTSKHPCVIMAVGGGGERGEEMAYGYGQRQKQELKECATHSEPCIHTV